MICSFSGAVGLLDRASVIARRFQCCRDQGEAKRMAAAGKAFLYDCLSIENVELYWATLLQKYAALTRFK